MPTPTNRNCHVSLRNVVKCNNSIQNNNNNKIKETKRTKMKNCFYYWASFAIKSKSELELRERALARGCEEEREAANRSVCLLFDADDASTGANSWKPSDFDDVLRFLRDVVARGDDDVACCVDGDSLLLVEASFCCSSSSSASASSLWCDALRLFFRSCCLILFFALRTCSVKNSASFFAWCFSTRNRFCSIAFCWAVKTHRKHNSYKNIDTFCRIMRAS